MLFFSSHAGFTDVYGDYMYDLVLYVVFVDVGPLSSILTDNQLTTSNVDLIFKITLKGKSLPLVVE